MPVHCFDRPGRGAAAATPVRHLPFRARRLLLPLGCAVLALLPVHGAMAQVAPGGDPETRGCSTLWQVTGVPAAGGDTPHLRVTLRFDGGRRSQTALHLPGGWTGVVEPGEAAAARLRPVPNEPAWRSVAHAPGQAVTLQWRLQPSVDGADLGHALFGPGWFAFSGLGVLPMPEGADDAGPACIQLQGAAGADPGARWASSHGLAEGTGVLWRLPPSSVPLAQRVQQGLYAGGALQTGQAPGVVALVPRPAPWPLDAAALAAAGSRALAVQQRQWPLPAATRDGREARDAAAARSPADARDTAPWLLLALPAPGAGAAAPAAGPTSQASAAAPAAGAASVPAVPGAGTASAWHHALALQLPPGWAGDDTALQRLLAPALARAWLSDRFGPLAHAGRGDTALRAWFSEGWADFLAQRSLLREGWWTPDDYAAALSAQAAADLADPARSVPNTQLAQLMQAAQALPDPAAAAAATAQLARLQARRGTWLALQWHQALRRAGQPGLEAALRLNLLPPGQSRHEGPISAPLATHRVLATLRGVLQEEPLHDLQRHIDQGQPFALGADSLGPCFTAAPPTSGAAPGAAPVWRPVPGALQQADCQGWLGTGPLVDMQPVARARSAGGGDCVQAPARGKRAKAAARAAVRCKADAAAPSGSRAPTAAGSATGKPGKVGKAAKTGGKPAAKASAKPGTKATAKAAPGAKPRPASR